MDNLDKTNLISNSKFRNQEMSLIFQFLIDWISLQGRQVFVARLKH